VATTRREAPSKARSPLNLTILWVARKEIRAEETLDDEIPILNRFLQVHQHERMVGIDVVGTAGLILL
jgi:hypothetical protein